MSNAGRYARIVEELALLRRMIAAAGEIAELGYSLPDDVAKAIDHAESMIFELAQRRLTDVLHDVAPRTARRHPRPPRAALRAGRIDHRHPHRLRRPRRVARRPPAQRRSSSSGRRPAMGKTAFALGMAPHAALHGGRVRAGVLPRDEPARDHPAPPVERGPGRRQPDAHRQAQRDRLGEDRPGRRAAWPKPRSGSTTTPTSPSWRSAPRPASSSPRSVTWDWWSSTTCSS